MKKLVKRTFLTFKKQPILSVISPCFGKNRLLSTNSDYLFAQKKSDSGPKSEKIAHFVNTEKSIN